jgi:NAD(P)-dependent dehydrogenase (short-subunit alcohol dehydrogenase family)
MQNKTVLITGCSSGIGRAAALGLRERGWQVFATARKEKDVKELENLGFRSHLLDILDSQSIQEAVDWLLEETGGRLDALVNNAGYGQRGAVEDLSRQILRRQFEVNVFGLQELTNRLIPVFRRQGRGRIVNISSIAGRISLPYMGAYSASKYALEALSDALRNEVRRDGIRVSLIEPGVIKTEFRAKSQQYFGPVKKNKTSPHYEAYQKIYQNCARPLAPRQVAAGAVVKRIIHALQSRHPRARYSVTKEAYLFAVLRRIVPDSLIDFVHSRRIRRQKNK